MTSALTVKDAAAQLHCTPKTVYGLIRTKVIPCRRIGVGRGKILVDEEDVRRYWEASKGAEKPSTEAEEEIKMASRHLRPPSPSRRPS